MSPKYTDKNFRYASLSEILKPELIDKLSIHHGLELDGINFSIVENQETKNNNRTLFSALSQALSANTNYNEQIHSNIANYITNDEQWNRYKDYTEIINIVENIEDKAKNKNTDKDYKSLYTNYTFSNKNKGLMVELCAAAEIFHFTFGVVVLHGKHKKKKGIISTDKKNMKKKMRNLGQIYVYNCVSPDILYNSHGVKYYFLQLGGFKEDWEWFYIQPYRQLYEIPNGLYPARFKKVCQYPGKRYNQIQKSRTNIKSNALQSDLFEDYSLTSPLVFHYNGKEYFYRKSNQNDDGTLFSILNHTLFDKKHEMRLYIQMIISMKRQEINFAVHPGSQRNIPTQKQSLQSIKNQNLIAYRYFNSGDLIDLKIASSIFAFTFNCFGLDNNGKLFHLENIKHKVDRKSEVKPSRNGVHLNLLVIGNEKDFIMKWYRLELSPTIWTTYLSSNTAEYKETTTSTNDEETTDTATSTSLPSDYEYVTSGKETGDSDYSKVDPESNNVSESSRTTDNTDTTTNNNTSTAETNESNSESSSADEAIGPKLSIFKSIPIFSLMQQKKSSKSNVLSRINNWLFSRSNSTTKILLIPKEPINQDQNTIYEADKKTTSILKGNIPWLTSIPDSDYLILTVDKSKPSTYLPLLALQQRIKDDLQETVWSPLYNQYTSSDESSEELGSNTSETEDTSLTESDHWSDANNELDKRPLPTEEVQNGLINTMESPQRSSGSRTNRLVSIPLNTISWLGNAVVSGYRGLFRILTPRRRRIRARVEPSSKEHLL